MNKIVMWKKSSHSHANGECVEVAPLPRTTALRDSKRPDAAVLAVSRSAFSKLVKHVK